MLMVFLSFTQLAGNLGRKTLWQIRNGIRLLQVETMQLSFSSTRLQPRLPHPVPNRCLSGDAGDGRYHLPWRLREVRGSYSKLETGTVDWERRWVCCLRSRRWMKLMMRRLLQRCLHGQSSLPSHASKNGENYETVGGKKSNKPILVKERLVQG